MPGKSEESREDATGERYLNGRAFLSHYAHVQVGRKRSAKCGFCSQGLGAVVAIDESTIPKPEVDEGDRSDEKRAATSPSSDEWLGRYGESVMHKVP